MIQAEMFASLCALTRREKLDGSYHAAFYLLSTDEELFEKARAHVDIDGIDFVKIKHGCRGLDERQRQLLDVAHNLFSWSSRCPATPYDLSCLGYPTLDYVCSALYIANGAFSVQIIKNDAGVPELTLDKARYEQNRRIYHQLFSTTEWAADPEENDMEIG